MYNPSMVRTQIYLPESLHKKLLAMRKSSGKSAAQIIREALADVFDKKPVENDLLDLANLDIVGGPADLSSKLDDYLYGER